MVRIRVRLSHLQQVAVVTCFLTHSGARIGTFDWNLVGGHFVDLVVHARRPLDTAQLLSLGQLAMTEDTRPVFVRRQGEALKDSLSVPPPS